MQLREARPEDGEALAAIYNPFITDSIVTFEETPVDGAEMARRLRAVQAAGLPWLVLEEGGALPGYAYPAPFHRRAAYRHSVEITVYVAQPHQGRGHGARLYEDLFARLAASGIHALIGCIALPNAPSVALHEKFGLRKVGHFAQVGRKFGRWIDVGYWERLLEAPP